MLDKDYLLEKITEEQILEIMANHGAVQFGATKENEIWFNTICHGGNSRNKLCYFRDSKRFYCYTNCGEMDIIGLIMKVRGIVFQDALKYIASVMGYSDRHGFNTRIPMMTVELNKIDRYIRLRKPKSTVLNNLPKINEKILSYFEDNVFYTGWIEEGISVDTMQRFGIRWYEAEKHIIIPHYNLNHELVGIRRRSLQEKDVNRKYSPEIIEDIQYSHSLNMNLYGLDMHLTGINKTHKVVIVESEKSVLLAHDYYGEDAFVVATCGFNVSNWHRDILLSLGVEEVMLGFDKDFNPADFEHSSEEYPEYKDYMRYIKRIYSLAHKFTAYCRTYVLWDTENFLQKKDSPFDRGKDVLEKIMKNKIEITTEREEES